MKAQTKMRHGKTIFLERTRDSCRQSNTGTVSKATLGKLLRNKVEHIWAFLSTQILSSTELDKKKKNHPLGIKQTQHFHPEHYLLLLITTSVDALCWQPGTGVTCHLMRKASSELRVLPQPARLTQNHYRDVQKKLYK